MRKTLLLIATSLLLNVGAAFAQMADVTAQYITNADFEACDALPTVVYHDNQKDIDVNKIELWSHWNTPKGTDYESQGWKLVEQAKNANGGVVTYGCNIQSGQYAAAGEPGPASGVTGNKGLCFCGAAGLIYQQTDEITLPAGIYRLTVNLYARNGQTSNPGPTQQVNNVKTGFMPTGGGEDDLIPAKRASVQFASNAWDQDVLDIELTEPTKGRFQICYGSSYFVIVDDIKLEYQGGVVTTPLVNVITKAQALNAELENADLTTAISVAQAFVQEPTIQEDVPTQVEALYNAMSTALAATTKVVDITSAYVANHSFETGKVEPWEWTVNSGTIAEPVNTESNAYIDGKNVAYFNTTGSNNIIQTISHLPVGYYIAAAKLNGGKAKIVLGGTSTERLGGSDALFLRVFSPASEFATGEITIGFKGSVVYRMDDFHIYYGKDAASLNDTILQLVKADAQALLDAGQFSIITGKERTELAEAIAGDNGVTINTKANAFYKSLSDYSDFEKAKTAAEDYNKDLYPYAKESIYQQIQTLTTTVAESATHAALLVENLSEACFNYYVSNYYCEGVENTDYTAQILGANATENPTGWGVKNMTVRTDKAGWTNPKTGEVDKVVYGVTTDYYRACKDEASILKQTLTGLPAGKYVLSMTAMGSNNLTINVFFNSKPIGEIVTVGTSGGGKYGAGWNDYAIEFTKADDTDMPLQLQCKPTANYQDWYIDNFRLYKLTENGDGIENVSNVKCQVSNEVYDLSGRKVVKPTKGLYIVGGKKVVLK